MLTLVESVQQRRAAWRQLRREFIRGGRSTLRSLGSRYGAGINTINLREDLKVWIGPLEQIRNYLWLAFGTLPLPKSGNVSMIVQINASLDPQTQRTGGLLARDIGGDLWICHTGGVGGGRDGINKSAFLAWTDRQPEPIVRGKGKDCSAFRIARLGSPTMTRDISDFVHEVAAFKDNPKPRHKIIQSEPFGGRPNEQEHSTVVSSRQGYKMKREHGIVRNRLSDLLSDAGLKVSRDTARDIIIGNPKRPDFEFEVKPTADAQSIYTAVGQLLMHSKAFPAKRRVVVLPKGLDRRRAAALDKLRIVVVTFDKRKDRITFSGLKQLVPRASSIAPLNTRKR